MNHALKYENLASKLPTLIERYDLQFYLPSFDNGGEGVQPFSLENLTNRCIASMQRHYANDFAALGYSQLLQDTAPIDQASLVKSQLWR